MALCSGLTVGDHCCWVDGEICRFLEIDTVQGRHWVCGLRRELGSWDKVHADSRYLEHVRPFWQRFNPSLNCGDWPPAGETCVVCEVIGDG
jgi:hypothetical protein